MEQQRKDIDLELVKSLMDDKYYLIYVDYNDNLNDRPDIFRKCLEDKCADHLYELFDEWYSDTERQAVGDAMEELKKHLVGVGYRRWEAEKFFDENEEAVREEIYSRGDCDGIEKLLRHTRDIPVRVEMYSNHDCINSHWFEGQGGFSYEESYWGDMIDVLRLNPRKVKQMLVEHGEKVRGRFPDRRSRNGRELVSYEHFYREHINSSAPANLLTFMATLDSTQLYESGFKLSKLTIPKGNMCGLYSSACGGGSILEMELLHDMVIDLDRTEYPKYGLEVEAEGKGCGYSIKQTYGLDNSAYGKPLSIQPVRDDNRIPA